MPLLLLQIYLRYFNKSSKLHVPERIQRGSHLQVTKINVQLSNFLPFLSQKWLKINKYPSVCLSYIKQALQVLKMQSNVGFHL